MLATKDHKLPAVFGFKEYPNAGGLMSIRGEPPKHVGESPYMLTESSKGLGRPTPVELPTKFELVIKLRTAKSLGLDVPPALLGRADEVIE